MIFNTNLSNFYILLNYKTNLSVWLLFHLFKLCKMRNHARTDYIYSYTLATRLRSYAIQDDLNLH